MSPADRLAVRLKSVKSRLPTATAVVVGMEVTRTLVNNPGPCDPPDFSGNEKDGFVFCGLPVWGNEQNPDEFSVVVPIP